MKTPHSHLLRLCVAEVLASVGYQKSSKHSLNILTDVTYYIITNLCREYEKGTFDLRANQNITHGDLNLFYPTQNTHESLLHKLNILPKGIDYKGKGGGVLHGEIYDEESFDSHFSDFVYSFACNTETNSVNMNVDINNTTNNSYTQEQPANRQSSIESSQEDGTTVCSPDILLEQLIIETKEGGWMEISSYKKMLHEKKTKTLHVYENEHHCDIIDELRCFINREADKRG